MHIKDNFDYILILSILLISSLADLLVFIDIIPYQLFRAIRFVIILTIAVLFIIYLKPETKYTSDDIDNVLPQYCPLCNALLNWSDESEYPETNTSSDFYKVTCNGKELHTWTIEHDRVDNAIMIYSSDGIVADIFRNENDEIENHSSTTECSWCGEGKEIFDEKKGEYVCTNKNCPSNKINNDDELLCL